MAIYTRKGDKGKTSLGSGKRVYKDSVRVQAYGTTDELNSYLGVICAAMSGKKIFADLLQITITVQNDLFVIGSNLSNPDLFLSYETLEEHTESFEKEIDKMTSKMKPLSNFILPGGGVVGAHFQYARSLDRRAERAVVSLLKEEEVDARVVKYLNRLSDLLFTMSRYANFLEDKSEVIWKSEQ